MRRRNAHTAQAYNPCLRSRASVAVRRAAPLRRARRWLHGAQRCATCWCTTYALTASRVDVTAQARDGSAHVKDDASAKRTGDLLCLDDVDVLLLRRLNVGVCVDKYRRAVLQTWSTLFWVSPSPTHGQSGATLQLALSMRNLIS